MGVTQQDNVLLRVTCTAKTEQNLYLKKNNIFLLDIISLSFIHYVLYSVFWYESANDVVKKEFRFFRTFLWYVPLKTRLEVRLFLFWYIRLYLPYT